LDPIDLEATKLAFGLAKDLAVQLLTLASAFIGLTVVLSKDIKQRHSAIELILVFSVLVVYFVSVLSGVYVLMKLTGLLAPLDNQIKFSLDAARPSAAAQIGTFVLATLLFGLYGAVAISDLYRKGRPTASATSPACR
jgi:hypothetical protein